MATRMTVRQLQAKLMERSKQAKNHQVTYYKTLTIGSVNVPIRVMGEEDVTRTAH